MNKITKRLYILYSLCIVAMVLLDQITKAAIVKAIPLYGEKELIKGFFSFYHTQNTGSAFSFLADKDWGIYVLSGVSVLMALLILFLMVRSIKLNLQLIAVSCALLFAGAVGNLIDRFRLKYVVDFFSFTFGTYNFAIFNVADIFAVCGTILFVVCIIFDSNKFDALLSFMDKKPTEVKTEETTNADS